MKRAEVAVRELLGGKLRDSDSAEGQGLAKLESLNSRLTITGVSVEKVVAVFRCLGESSSS